MYSLNSCENKYGVTRDDSDRSSVDVAYQPLLGRASTTGSIDPYVRNFTSNNDVNNSTSSPNQSLCNWYRYISNLEVASEGCHDNFLQEYAIKCGYKFTKSFLSTMNKQKIGFIYKIDSVLIGLYGVVYGFLKDLGTDDKDVHLMNRACSSFSKYAYDLRYNFIDVLQSDIIPTVIKSIFDSKVIDGSSERKMTYPEMEQLFLHFVSTLENLIMVKMMKYWSDFCLNKKRYLSSLALGVDYSNPFVCAYNFDKVVPVNINCPAAFTYRFGKYVSFMAVDKINEMANHFFSKCSYKFKEVIGSKYSYVCDCIDRDYVADEELVCKFKGLVKEEFNKIIVEEVIKERFSNFLRDIVIWNEDYGVETNVVLISDKIVEHVRNFIRHMGSLLINNATRNAHKIIEGRWGVKIHPEDDSKIISIKRKFITKFRMVIKDKFCSMLREKYEFLDGSVIGVFDWDKVSKNLFPIAQETISKLVNEEHAELSRFLSSVRVIERVSMIDEYSTYTRNITSEEIDKILNVYVGSIHDRNRDLFSAVWKNLINSTDFNISGDIGSVGVGSKKDIASIVKPVLVPPPVDDGSSLSVVSSVQNKPVAVDYGAIYLADKRDRIFNMWRVNLHSDDDRIIHFIRRKYSHKINGHLTRLFSGMLRRGTVLPSGKVPQYYSWSHICRELSEIAIKSVSSIIEKQYEELSKVVSESRVVDIDESNSSFRVNREVTDDEKKEIMECAKKLIDKRLNLSIRKSWLCAVNKSSPEIVHGCRERSRNISASDREERWGVKLRHIDNLAILNIRRKFSSKIRNIVYNKFSSMVINNHKFDDDTFIGAFAWFRLSKKLLPIAKEEIAPVLESEKKELENIISKSRVLISLEGDREITGEEKSTVFKNVVNIVCNDALNRLFRSVWDDVISSCAGSVDIDNYVATASSNVNFTNKVPVMENTIEVDEGKNDRNLGINLCYEDDIDILNTRRKFSSEICSCIRDKYSRMLQEGYEFDDGTIIGTYSWKEISKKLLPVIIKETDPLVEKERKKISDMLLKSRVYVSSPDSHSTTRITRELRPEERSAVMKTVMKSAYKSVRGHFSQIWKEIIKSPSLSLKDLMESYRSELDNIRLEFFGSLGSIVDEVVGSLSSDVTNTSDSYSLCYPNISNIVSERSCNLFKEGGFFDRVELLLSYAKGVDTSGNSRLITNGEKKLILREFMDTICYDRDCLIKKRSRKLESRCKRKRDMVTL